MAEPAFWRAAAAGRCRTRAGDRASGPPPRRAALQPRREAPRAASGRDADPPTPPRDDLRLRDPRPGGGALALRLDRGDERGQGRAGRSALGDLLPPEDRVSR